MTYDPVKCCKIIVTCMILHSKCISANLPVDEYVELDGDVIGEMQDSYNEVADNVPDGANVGFEVRRRLIQERFV